MEWILEVLKNKELNPNFIEIGIFLFLRYRLLKHLPYRFANGQNLHERHLSHNEKIVLVEDQVAPYSLALIQFAPSIIFS